MPGGRPRKVRDQPKKPLSAYTLFVVEVRNSVQKENPSLSFKQVAELVGKKWRELSDFEREKYHRLALEDKERYEREKEEYKRRPPPSVLEDDKKRRKKPKDAPKNPLSAYTFYVMDVRKEVQNRHPDFSFKEVAVKVGEMWRQLDPDTREHYNQKAEQDKARYENEMMEWNARLEAQAAEREMEARSKKKKRVGPKNPLSSYTYFVMEMRPQVSVQNPKMSFGEVAIRVGEMWRNLSKEERQKYNNLAAEDKARYEAERERMKQQMERFRVPPAATNHMMHRQHVHAAHAPPPMPPHAFLPHAHHPGHHQHLPSHLTFM